MSSADADFLQQLRATFRVEAEEHLQAITAGLLQLEQVPAPAQRRALVETVFRAAHSLKGAARAVEFRHVESTCQAMEDELAGWKRQETDPPKAALDGLHLQLDRLAAQLAASAPPPPGSASPAAAPVPWRVPARPPTTEPDPAPAPVPAPAHGPEPAPPAARRAAGAGETVRIAAEVLDARLLDAEQMLSVKLAAGQRVDDLHALARRVKAWRAEDEAGEAGRQQERLKALEQRLGSAARAAEQDLEEAGKLVDDLLANTKKLLLLPFATIASGLPKLVRDLCREQGKEADFEITGEQTPLDKRILDAIRDPLVHLLRNCVDHGVETGAERLRRGKPARARIVLAVSQVAGGKVQITLRDDGAGIDVARLKAAAVQQGVVSPEEAERLADAEAQALVFRSGVSTRPSVTELSGRGLGLAIVQENAARLGGEVTIASVAGAGTEFRILVPALRATFRGILVEAGGRLLVLPTTQVERAGRVRSEDIRTIEGRDTITLQGRVIPLVRLAQLLELPEPSRPAAVPGGFPLLVLGSAEQRVAIVVDEVLDEQELLVKPLSRPLVRVRNVASATVLPNGRIALILHVGDLLQSAGRPLERPQRGPRGAAPPAPKTVLVAEDSITSRMLIKGILESAGYRVTTVPDGVEALGRMRAERFDLVVSDVEMPRLNGFDLTARIRADARLAATPVVLVTGLARSADRERGLDVGANAYIVKSSFDQTTLVDAVRRLA